MIMIKKKHDPVIMFRLDRRYYCL